MEYQWPYENEYGQTEIVETDVLVEKGATKRSGSAGTGFPCVFSRKIFWKAAKGSLFWGRSILAENC